MVERRKSSRTATSGTPPTEVARFDALPGEVVAAALVWCATTAFWKIRLVSRQLAALVREHANQLLTGKLDRLPCAINRAEVAEILCGIHELALFCGRPLGRPVVPLKFQSAVMHTCTIVERSSWNDGSMTAADPLIEGFPCAGDKEVGYIARLDIRALELIYLVFGTADIRDMGPGYLGRELHWTTPAGVFEFTEEQVIRFLRILHYIGEHRRSNHVTLSDAEHAMQCLFRQTAFPVAEGDDDGESDDDEYELEEEEEFEEEMEEEGHQRYQLRDNDGNVPLLFSPCTLSDLPEVAAEAIVCHALDCEEEQKPLYRTCQAKLDKRSGGLHSMHVPLPAPPPGCASRFCCHQACDCRPADVLFYEGVCHSIQRPVGMHATDLHNYWEDTGGLPADIDAAVARFVHEHSPSPRPPCTCTAALEHRRILADRARQLEAAMQDPVAALASIGWTVDPDPRA